MRLSTLRAVASRRCIRSSAHSGCSTVPSSTMLTGPESSPANAQPRVLSIQSHVVHGYVGNKCAVFPLQLNGFDVDFINSVQFSNHTSYPIWKGSVSDGPHLWDLVEGLESNGLATYSHLLTGYIGSTSLLETIARVVRKLREYNSNLVYVCDPVMGDEGRLYVKPELIEAFKQHIVPLASIITPNQFEAELLTGVQIKSIQDAIHACRKLHDQGPHTVVVTSMDCVGSDHIVLVASTRQPQAEGCPQQLHLSIPRIPAYFTGTGDLLAALLLLWLHRLPSSLSTAVELAVASLQGVLLNTAQACGEAATTTERTAQIFKARELRLIQSQQQLLHPVVTVKAVPWTGAE